MSSIITSNDAQYSYDIVKAICDEVGPGNPGTPQERARAMIIKQELEKHLGPENVAVEEFSVRPGSFLGWLPIGAVIILIAALLNVYGASIPWIPAWLSSGISLALSLLVVLTGILQFVFYYEFAEPIFKQKTSINVIGTLRKPGTKTVKRLLLLGGHHDSALEMTWLRFLGYGYYAAVATLFIGFAAMMVFSAIQLTGILAGSPGTTSAGTLGWKALAYPIVPSIIFAAFFNRGYANGGNVPGAADNLSASALAVSMCRFLVKHPEYVPDDTEIRFISFGSEEAGLRGSRRYVERHLDELKRLDARLLNLETVTHPVITILTSDVNGTVKNSPEMVESVAAAAVRSGVPHKVEPFPFGGGGTDGGSFSQAGLKALTLLPFKVPGQMVAFYHQKWDAPEVLTLEPLQNVMKLTLEWVRSGGR